MVEGSAVRLEGRRAWGAAESVCAKDMQNFARAAIHCDNPTLARGGVRAFLFRPIHKIHEAANLLSPIYLIVS
jgi:hypothetical protein